jgi:hypothetical protein
MGTPTAGSIVASRRPVLPAVDVSRSVEGDQFLHRRGSAKLLHVLLRTLVAFSLRQKLADLLPGLLETQSSRRDAFGHLHDMVAKLRLEDVGNLTDLEGERLIFELRHHLSATEDAEGSATRTAWPLTVGSRHLSEIGSVHDLLTNTGKLRLEGGAFVFGGVVLGCEDDVSRRHLLGLLEVLGFAS